MLLREQLLQKHPNLEIVVKLGHPQVEGNDGSLYSHAWVEVSDPETTKIDPIVLDASPDQAHALGTHAPKTIASYKSELEEEGIFYNAKRDLTPETLEPEAQRRVSRLRNKHDYIVRHAKFYDGLLHKNIYVIGSVASGKTGLVKGLQDVLPHKTVDMGSLFRVAAHTILHDSEDTRINPDFDKLEEGNQNERSRISQALFKKTRLLQETLRKTHIEKIRNKADRILVGGIDTTEYLDERHVNLLVSSVAQNPKVRQIVWGWVHDYAQNNGGLILTGHSLREIDTTAYKTIQLIVSDQEAIRRLRKRMDESDKTLQTMVQQRNEDDGIVATSNLLQQAHDVDTIDTSNLSQNEVRFKALRRIAKSARTRNITLFEQASKGVNREKFSWTTNPLLASVRGEARDVFHDVASNRRENGLTEFDVAIQTIIHLSGKPASEFWGDNDCLGAIEKGILSNNDVTSQMDHAIEVGNIHLNKEVVRNEAERQAKRLETIYRRTYTVVDGERIDLPASYMGDQKKSPFRNRQQNTELTKNGNRSRIDSETGMQELVVCEKVSGKQVTLKLVPPEISKMYADGFHYLHQGRTDEIAAYGAYAEGDSLPYAWVSYSPVDRPYKKAMLHYLGIEPHTMLEMTRAWNASWAPKNTMSVLFAFAHNDLQRLRKDEVRAMQVDKPLSGVITAINGNLGFQANAFNGVGFETCGLKPANFTFLRDEQGNLNYMPRRGIMQELGVSNLKELREHERYATNMVPLIPTNEMVVLFDRSRMKSLLEKPIYTISSGAYRS